MVETSNAQPVLSDTNSPLAASEDTNSAQNSSEQAEVKQSLSESTTGSEIGDTANTVGTNNSSNSDYAQVNERQLLTFEEDLWDNLDRVSAYHKHGSSMVLGL